MFCGIIAGRAAASIVHRDGHVMAFMDIQPVTSGHVLVVPQARAPSLEELGGDQGARVFRAAHRVACALRRSGLPCEGVNMFLADGVAAFQEVFHVHLHVFPRAPGDGFALTARWRPRERPDLDAAAEQVRQGLRALLPDPAAPGHGARSVRRQHPPRRSRRASWPPARYPRRHTGGDADPPFGASG
jgi:histidine triad (HIT) family protein